MTPNMTIRLCELGARLHGKTAGRADFARLCGLLTQTQPGQIIFLDFADVSLVNGSWLNMAVAPLFRWAAESQHDVFPVLARFPDDWVDELELVAQVHGQCYPLADRCEEPIVSLLIVGPLEESLRDTFRSLTPLKAATGAELARQEPRAKIQPTAWNNRLKDLYDKRLLVRRKEGRQQIYSPLAEEVRFRG